MNDELLLWAILGGTGLVVTVWLGVLTLGTSTRRAGVWYARRFTGDVGRGLQDQLLFIDAARLLRANVALMLVAGAGIGLLTESWLFGLAGAGLIASLPKLVLARLSKRRKQLFAAQLPDALLQISSAMRAGASLPLALRQLSQEAPAPCGQEFGLMLREQQLGATLGTALASLERRMDVEDLRLMTAAIRIAGETGGNLAETLERLSETIRRKLSVEAKLQSLTAQGRLQGWVMMALPLIVALALFFIEPEAMSPLINSWQGWIVCGVIATLELIGLVMIRRIMDIDV